MLKDKVPRTGVVPASLTPISMFADSYENEYPSSTLISHVFVSAIPPALNCALVSVVANTEVFLDKLLAIVLFSFMH